LKDANLMNA